MTYIETFAKREGRFNVVFLSQNNTKTNTNNK